MATIYTKNGDGGETGLLGQERTSKANIRIEVLGAIDEASAALAVARSFIKDTQTNLMILQIQKDLYLLMAEVGASPENAAKFRKVGQDHITWLESKIEACIATTGAPKNFIIPGEIRSSAMLSLARTVVRRAERRMVELHVSEPFENPHLLTYLNRLSSLCFALELLENHDHGAETREIKNL